MRIIAGRARGITLKCPDSDTRPTTDRTREAVFSMLGGTCQDLRVLDLFAGTGALGLEALSRGAAEAVLVEQNRKAFAVLEDNARRTKLEGARLIKGDVFDTLDQFAKGGLRFDIIFADPPYAKQPGDPDFGAKLLASPSLRSVLAEGGIFVLETMMTKRAATAIAGWHIVRDRAYGSTRVLLLNAESTPAPLGEIPHPSIAPIEISRPAPL
jgi:16S rRNA (guanine966-N2)-methyltransferase